MLSAYVKFSHSIKSPQTLKSYESFMKKFFNHVHSDYENLVKLPINDISDLVMEYVVYLKNLTETKNVPSPNSYNTMLSGVQSFLEANDILLNWKKIKKMYPQRVQSANQMPYTDEDVRVLLDATGNLRNKAFIHFLSSTAIRVGAIVGLKIRHIFPMEDGALVLIQEGTLEEYRAGLTPEAYSVLKRYLSRRTSKNPDDSLFTDKDNITPIALVGAREVLRHIVRTAKISIGNGRTSPKGKSMNHAFRKRALICMANANLQEKYIESLMGHFKNQDKFYFRGTSNIALWTQFKKAIPFLTLDNMQKNEITKSDEIRTLTEDFKAEFKEKQELMEQQMVEMQFSLASTKFMMYDKMYLKSYPPNPVELKNLMSVDEINDWNWACNVLKKSEWVIDLNASEKLMKNIKELKETKKMASQLDKKTDGATVVLLESIINELKEEIKN